MVVGRLRRHRRRSGTRVPSLCRPTSCSSADLRDRRRRRPSTPPAPLRRLVADIEGVECGLVEDPYSWDHAAAAIAEPPGQGVAAAAAGIKERRKGVQWSEEEHSQGDSFRFSHDEQVAVKGRGVYYAFYKGDAAAANLGLLKNGDSTGGGWSRGSSCAGGSDGSTMSWSFVTSELEDVQGRDRSSPVSCGCEPDALSTTMASLDWQGEDEKIVGEEEVARGGGGNEAVVLHEAAKSEATPGRLPLERRMAGSHPQDPVSTGATHGRQPPPRPR